MPSTLQAICNKITVVLVRINIKRTWSIELFDLKFFFYSDGNDILVAKFNYQAQEGHELSIVKNERLVLLDDSCPWWKVKRIDSDDIG